MKYPPSFTQCMPVISPLPLSAWNPAHTGIRFGAWPCGRITVTPVLTGASPEDDRCCPLISVATPISTPGTSVSAFHRPHSPENGSPSARPRNFGATTTGGDIGLVMTSVWYIYTKIDMLLATYH